MKGLYRLCSKCPYRNTDCYVDLVFGIKHCKEIIEDERRRKLGDLISFIIGFPLYLIGMGIPLFIVYWLFKSVIKILAGC